MVRVSDGAAAVLQHHFASCRSMQWFGGSGAQGEERGEASHFVIASIGHKSQRHCLPCTNLTGIRNLVRCPGPQHELSVHMGWQPEDGQGYGQSRQIKFD